MAVRDPRYKKIKRQIEYGEIKEIKDFTEIVPKSTIAKDLNKKTAKLTKLMRNCEDFTFREVFKLGSFCDLTEETMINLVLTQYRNNKG